VSVQVDPVMGAQGPLYAQRSNSSSSCRPGPMTAMPPSIRAAIPGPSIPIGPARSGPART
jgi:pyridoxal/pyridoxine/pyridoxamine kinase